MRIELTIKTTYLPNWNVWEGVRELVQNAKDAETEFGAKMTVRHRKDTDTLVIENEGTTLPHEALLLGFTSKDSRSDTIGKFGEGLKLGILALVRFGLKVKIRSGSEVWVPVIARSEKFDADVLAFDIYKGRKHENRVQIEVSGIPQDAWEQHFRPRFLFLVPPSARSRIETSYGSLLLAPEAIGKVYVQGIHIMDEPKFTYGYNILEAEVDRDRKMVASYDLQWRTAMIWAEALNARPDMLPKYMELLGAHSGDLLNMSEYSAGRLTSESRASVVEAFLARHGANAVPVGSLADSVDIEHLGMQGVVVAPALRKVLEVELGNLESRKAKLREQIEKKFGWGDLGTFAREALTSAIALVDAVEPISLADVDVCLFRDEKILGLFNEGRVQLSVGVLADDDTALATLVHEVAHKAGGADGEKKHVENMERIWSGIVANLRRPNLQR